MKFSSITLFCSILALNLSAQNTFPTSGNVGIGTTALTGEYLLDPVVKIAGYRPALSIIPAVGGFGTGDIQFGSKSAETEQMWIEYRNGSASKLSIYGWRLNGTQQIEAFTVTGNGRVGINSPSPYYNFEVLGTTDPAIYVAHPYIGALTLGIATNNSSYSLNSLQGDAIISARGAVAKNLLLTSDNGRIGFATGAGNIERLTILSNGNIGIGNAIPIASLDVVKTDADAIIKLNRNATYNGSYGRAGLNIGTGWLFIDYFPSYGSGVLRMSNGSREIFLGEYGSMVTTQGNSNFVGRVTMGSSNMATPAGYQLYVATGILTEKVKVAVQGTTNWSDFVFNKDYKLANLHDVESYINKNKHLPEIPSAAEVVKDGIDVAKIDAKLLQKIEELTLYAIELNKKMEECQAKIKQLEKK